MEDYKIFLRTIPVFDEFEKISDESSFVQVPEDWYLFLTDVKGSTKAIQSGMYQSVNMAGVSGICGILNELGDYDLPYVFGGDGAAILVPPDGYSKALQALKKIQCWTHKTFSFELRGHVIQLKDLYESHHFLLVGKYQLSPGNNVFQFRGGAFKLADKCMKSASLGKVVLPDKNEEHPDLHGLSCRWQPLKSQKGEILTLLVSVLKEDPESFVVYKKILFELREIFGGDLKNASPVTFSGLKNKMAQHAFND